MTMRYRVITDNPTFHDDFGQLTDSPSYFRKGAVLVHANVDRRDEPLAPDSDGDVYMALEGSESYIGCGYIQLSQLQLITDDPATDDAFIPFDTYLDAAERLGLSEEFARVSQLAEALHAVTVLTQETSA